jgi:hypothetical protein
VTPPSTGESCANLLPRSGRRIYFIAGAGGSPWSGCGGFNRTYSGWFASAAASGFRRRSIRSTCERDARLADNSNRSGPRTRAPIHNPDGGSCQVHRQPRCDGRVRKHPPDKRAGGRRNRFCLPPQWDPAARDRGPSDPVCRRLNASWQHAGRAHPDYRPARRRNRASNTAGSRGIGTFRGMEAPPVERHLAAILAADVEGYSSLMHGDEEATMATLSARRVSTSSLGSIEGGLRTPPAIASLPNS